MDISHGSVMVYIEISKEMPIKASLETLAPARQIAAEKEVPVTALVIGGSSSVTEQISPFADKIICVKGPEIDRYHPDIYTFIINTIIDKYHPSIFLAGSTPQGKELAARCAHHVGADVIADAVNHFTDENHNVIWTVPVYGGTILNNVLLLGHSTQIITIRSGAYKKPSVPPSSASVPAAVIKEALRIPSSAIHLSILKSVQEISEIINLEDAEIIVSGGRGMGSAGNFALVEELAKVLGGVTGATRPAIEAGWVSRAHQVGQSGRIVAPKLYIACGISGATQHISGMTGSGYVVAINKDEDAPIFDVADIGIIGNAMDILPVMIQEIRRLRQ